MMYMSAPPPFLTDRDLKPENLIMTSGDSDADLKIVDFGFAAIDTGGSSSAVVVCCLCLALTLTLSPLLLASVCLPCMHRLHADGPLRHAHVRGARDPAEDPARQVSSLCVC